MDRPITPPPQTTSRQTPLTPEQLKRIEINRLRAKAKLRAHQEKQTSGASGSSSTNEHNKRPLTITPDTSKSPTAPSRKHGAAPNPNAPLKPDSRLGKYLEYDLSKMVDSRGGFLLQEKSGDNDDERRRTLQRERERMKHNSELLPTFVDPARNPKCQHCGSMEIDPTFKNIFDCLVCNKCKDAMPDRYSLLTKSECKEDYLLTDPELRDTELLPHLLKANPHKATWNNMMLYLRYQVEEFAWKKWGSAEDLDKEYERRENEKRKKKSKKFEDGLKDLRRRTREGVWQKRKDEEHKHEFGEIEHTESGSFQRCKECEMEIEVEEL